MNKGRVTLQIGKNGFSEGLIETIEDCFKTRENIKISLLKSAGHSRENVKKIAEKIIKRLGNKYTYRIVGFTIFLKKWRKPRKN